MRRSRLGADDLGDQMGVGLQIGADRADGVHDLGLVVIGQMRGLNRALKPGQRGQLVRGAGAARDGLTDLGFETKRADTGAEPARGGALIGPAGDVLAQAGQLQAGEVVLCTVNGPMKVMVGADGIPTQAPVDTADGGGCEFCCSASVSIAFAISVLGLWQSESGDSPRARTADARFITPPDKRHAPAQAPPSLS